MTLPVGQISMSQVDVELGQPSTQVITLNDANVRSLAGVPTGAISMSNLQGKSNVFAFTVASGVNVNLHSAAITAGWPGSGAVQATIPSANTISSSSTGSYALTIDGAWPGGVTLTNSGTIVGAGGNGGNGASNPGSGYGTVIGGTPGGVGGPALLASVAVTINNASGTIGGGGGGGGGGGVAPVSKGIFRGGSSGGGGAGNVAGVAGSVGSANNGGGSPGSPGTLTTGGSGATSGGTFPSTSGNGGAQGSAGTDGTTTNPSSYVGNTGGGAGGGAVNGNSFITWTSTGTRNGPIV